MNMTMCISYTQSLYLVECLVDVFSKVYRLFRGNLPNIWWEWHTEWTRKWNVCSRRNTWTQYLHEFQFWWWDFSLCVWIKQWVRCMFACLLYVHVSILAVCRFFLKWNVKTIFLFNVISVHFHRAIVARQWNLLVHHWNWYRRTLIQETTLYGCRQSRMCHAIGWKWKVQIFEITFRDKYSSSVQ